MSIVNGKYVSILYQYFKCASAEKLMLKNWKSRKWVRVELAALVVAQN